MIDVAIIVVAVLAAVAVGIVAYVVRDLAIRWFADRAVAREAKHGELERRLVDVERSSAEVSKRLGAFEAATAAGRPVRR